MIYDDLLIFVLDLQIAHMGSNLGLVSVTNTWKRHRMKIISSWILYGAQTIIWTKLFSVFFYPAQTIIYLAQTIIYLATAHCPNTAQVQFVAFLGSAHTRKIIG